MYAGANGSRKLRHRDLFPPRSRSLSDGPFAARRRMPRQSTLVERRLGRLAACRPRDLRPGGQGDCGNMASAGRTQRPATPVGNVNSVAESVPLLGLKQCLRPSSAFLVVHRHCSGTSRGTRRISTGRHAVERIARPGQKEVVGAPRRRSTDAILVRMSSFNPAQLGMWGRKRWTSLSAPTTIE